MVGGLRLESIEKNNFKAFITSSAPYKNQFAPVNTAFCAIAKGDKNEIITESLSQIGVQEIIFWQSHHSIPKPPYEKKLQKLKKISLESAVQCGREEPMKVRIIDKHDHLLKALSECSTPVLMCSLEDNSLPLSSVISHSQSFSFITGPEGDFSQDESAFIRPLSSHAITLGQNILKTDIAAIAAACMITALASKKPSS